MGTVNIQIRILVFLSFLILFPLNLISQEDQPADKKLYVVPIHGDIEKSLVVFINRGIKEAEKAGAEIIVFDINTFGGRVDSALQMAALAEKNGYPKGIALAMVDKDVELFEVNIGSELVAALSEDIPELEKKAQKEGESFEKGKIISSKGKLLTLTAGFSRILVSWKKNRCSPVGTVIRNTFVRRRMFSYTGYDKKGPTAVINFVAKLNHKSFKQCLLNQRLSPALLKGEKGTELFINYIDTICEAGIGHVQINVIDNNVLKAAQKTPENFSDLIVRIAGYSAYFNELNKLTQDAVISRTEQALA